MNLIPHLKEATTIVTPIFNDWASFQTLVRNIDAALSKVDMTAIIIAIDDGSTEPGPALDEALLPYTSVQRIEILRLARNMGHQRAIAIGLCYAESCCPSSIVIVMDADGEDDPATLPALIAKARVSGRILFAQRGHRQENVVFLAFYHLYRALFFMLTGQRISFGNYCAIPGSLLRRVVFLPEIWNHFAAGIMRSGLPQATLQLPRGTRYAGRSRMNFVGLILHGLSAISIYVDVLAVRLILFTIGVIFSTIAGSIVLLYIRFFTALAIPGWATSVAFGLGIILFQALIFLSLISFLVLNSRSAQMFIPVKHFADFLLTKEILYEQS